MAEKGKIENRRYARVTPIGLVSKMGKLILDPKQPAIDCRVIDLSAGGACLQTSTVMKLPKRFVFLHGGIKKHVHLVWQKHDRVGVGF